MGLVSISPPTITPGAWMSADPPVNSLAWWDKYFGANWDANDGGGQTRHFMERLVASLPPAVLTDLNRPGSEVLDWGCAQGQGVAVLQHAAPAARIAGLDCSDVALAVARRILPQHEWIHHPEGEIPRQFDAIVCSNTLEHFAHPLEPLRRLIAAARRLVIVLVPYLEHPLCEYHPAQFRDESFPDRLGPAVRIASRVVAVDPRHWPGEQLLVVYAQSEVAAELGAMATPEQALLRTIEVDRDADRQRADRFAAALDGLRRGMGELARKLGGETPKPGQEWPELLHRIDELLQEGAKTRAKLRQITDSRSWRLVERLRRWKRWARANTLGHLSNNKSNR